MINLASKASPKVVERFKLGSMTEGLFSNKYDWTGVETVRVYSIDTLPLQDYDKTKVDGTSRFGALTEVGDTIQEMKVTQDKAFNGVIDEGNNTNQLKIKAASSILKRQTDEVLIPYTDKYRLMLLGAFVGAFGATGNAIGAKANTTSTAQAQPQVEQAAPVQTAPTQAETTQQAAANNAPSQLNIDNGSARAYNNTNVNVANNIGGMTNVASGSVEADSGRVSGVYRGRDTIHRGEEKSSGAGVGSGFVLLSPQAKDTLAKRGVAVVETQDVSNDKPAFSAALDAARANDSVNGWAVTPKSVAELEESGAKLIMSANGTTGFAIAPDGDIEAVFANKAAGAPKGATKTTIPQAVANGGTKLDCYGEGLVTLYAKYGFVPVARVKFNPEYANQGWDTSKGTPDIFFMMHNGDSADTVVQKMGTYHRYTENELNALPAMDYDEAYSYRDSLLANSRKATDASQPAGDNLNHPRRKTLNRAILTR